MDFTEYYEEFQSTYNLAVITLCLAIFAVLFVGIRRIINKKESLKTKITAWIILVLMFASVLNMFLTGPALAKKDIEQQTILYYDGEFEIIETSHGIYDKAVFLLNGEEICLKYSDEEDYDFEQIKVGKYVGQIVYAKNLSLVLKLKIEEKFD